jgi:hypothetical protein
VVEADEEARLPLLQWQVWVSATQAGIQEPRRYSLSIRPTGYAGEHQDTGLCLGSSVSTSSHIFFLDPGPEILMTSHSILYKSYFTNNQRQATFFCSPFRATLDPYLGILDSVGIHFLGPTATLAFQSATETTHGPSITAFQCI